MKLRIISSTANFVYQSQKTSTTSRYTVFEMRGGGGGGVGGEGVTPPPPPIKKIAQDPGICAFQGDTGWVP